MRALPLLHGHVIDGRASVGQSSFRMRVDTDTILYDAEQVCDCRRERRRVASKK